MYDPINSKSGVQAASDWLSGFGVSETADGLTFAPPGPSLFGSAVGMPDRLRNWLIDLRLLRRIPLCYLVPDDALLPAESIRFFHLDPTWVDRVIDGVFAMASTGTVDFAFNCTLLAMVREALDNDLIDIAKQQVPGTSWTPATGITGVLIRSELTRRWPDMSVRAYANLDPDALITMPVLRAETVSKDIYIALFAGEPAMVEIAEPNVGIRFGVESADPNTSAPPYKVDRRNPDGSSPNTTPIEVELWSQSRRTLKIKQLATDIDPGNPSSRMVALHLEQRPYVQEFKSTRPESRGSVPLPVDQNGDLQPIQLSGGRSVRLDELKTRLLQLQELEEGA